MRHIRPRPSEPVSLAVPLLLAAGSLSLLALVWRRISAPRIERTLSRGGTERSRAGAPPTISSRAAEITPHAQLAPAGSGPLVHRRYDVLITGCTLPASALLRTLQRNLSALAPAALAHFEKSQGSDGLARVGDEYDITMLGPWNGRVRVIESTPRQFTLVTLDGHPEAGHITFSVAETGEFTETLQVLIESWARARDSVVALAYGTLGVGKQMQTEVWITFLQRLSALAGMDHTPEVRIATEEIAVEDIPPLPGLDA